MEGFETLTGSDELACDGFLKDRGEEDEVCVVAGLFDFGEGVAGDGDNRRREFSGGVEFADLAGVSWPGAEVRWTPWAAVAMAMSGRELMRSLVGVPWRFSRMRRVRRRVWRREGLFHGAGCSRCHRLPRGRFGG